MRKSGVFLLLLNLWFIHPAFSQGTRTLPQPKVRGSVRGKVIELGRQTSSE